MFNPGTFSSHTDTFLSSRNPLRQRLASRTTASSREGEVRRNKPLGLMRGSVWFTQCFPKKLTWGDIRHFYAARKTCFWPAPANAGQHVSLLKCCAAPRPRDGGVGVSAESSEDVLHGWWRSRDCYARAVQGAITGCDWEPFENVSDTWLWILNSHRRPVITWREEGVWQMEEGGISSPGRNYAATEAKLAGWKTKTWRRPSQIRIGYSGVRHPRVSGALYLFCQLFRLRGAPAALLLLIKGLNASGDAHVCFLGA